jgi:acyl-CoA synthetase (AMP-forming)/AMP-acid ligase II
MKNLLISSIVKAWNKPFMWSGIYESTYSDLAFEIVNLSTMLDSLKIKDPRIILSAKNSFAWVVVYLTAIIKDIPLTLISPTYSSWRRSSYINQCEGNILFTDDDNRDITGNVYLNAAIGIEETKGYKLYRYHLHPFLYRYHKIKNVPKKWRTLNDIFPREISVKLFEKFKDKTHKWSNTFSLGTYSAGVNSEPKLCILGDRTLYQASQGMVRKLCSMELTKKPIYVRLDFSFFSAISILTIIGGRGTIALTMFGERRNKIKGIIANTQYFENMWDYLAPFMAMKTHQWLEKWQITKWLNTIKLKKWFKEEIPENCETFFIINDETRSRLKDNLKRIGYKVISTYGIAETGQLISIDGQLIRGVEVKFTGLHPATIPSNLLVRTSNNLLLKTGDVATMGPNSKLIIHGRKDNKIITDDMFTIYPEKIERVLLSNEIIEQAFLTKMGDQLILFIYFNQTKMNMAKMSYDKGEILVEQIKDEINDYLPDGININRAEQLVEKLAENEQGKIIRYFYNHTPSLVN